MKNWMALLLVCLLCLCTARVQAEESVTLSLSDGNQIDIYPDGYQEKGKAFVPYTGKYIITGASKDVDTCLDFFSIPHETDVSVDKVEYTVVFQSVKIEAYMWHTTLRFGDREDKATNAKDITLNLINTGNSYVEAPWTFAVFSNSGNKNVMVNIHNAKGAQLKLTGKDNQYERYPGLAGKNVTIVGDGIEGSITYSDNYENNVKIKEIETSSCADRLVEHSAIEPNCIKEGNKQYWTCSLCETHFLDAGAQNVTTPDEVTISKLGHSLTLVPAKDPTCTKDGHASYYACANCPKLFEDENATLPLAQPKVISAEGHEFGADWQRDATQHWHVCECGERSGEAEHSFVTVVDRKPGETEPGEQHEECSVCGYRKAAVSIPAVGRIDLPQTGDSSRLTAWIALLGVSCACLLCLGRRRG